MKLWVFVRALGLDMSQFLSLYLHKAIPCQHDHILSTSNSSSDHTGTYVTLLHSNWLRTGTSHERLWTC